MNKEEIDILYSFANDEDCRDVYDWQGFNYEEICPLIDKLIKEDKKYKEVIDKAIEQINDYKIYCENNKGFTEYTDIEIEAIEPVISKLEDILKEVSK